MKKHKPEPEELVLIAAAWITSLALAYLVYIKIKMLF
jgi:hypothetical protein